MPKAYLKFSLPEESEEFKHAQDGQAYYCMLWDIQEYLRKLSQDERRRVIPTSEFIVKLRELIEDYES